MSERYDVNYLEVGDTHQGSPSEQGHFILAVLAAGGEVEIDGDTVVILQLPKKAPVEAVEVIPAEVEEVVAATIEAIEESPAPVEAAEELPAAPKPVPKPRGRKPKAASVPVESTEE